MGITLRHWQRWALRLQWAHRADGSLCYRNIIESTPRRSGKSVRLRSAAVYRTAHPELFGEQQLVMLVGKDSAIVLEHHRKTWQWARTHDWELRRRTGAEEIEAPDGSRFVIRGKDSCWGYDIGYAIADEAHGIHPSVIDDALEPSLLDRCLPQLHLVSTSARKATALMRRRINAAIANGYEDATTLVMVWAAPPGANYADPEVWKDANPYWTREREEFLTTKFEQAMSGQADPTDDDPDPIQSFISQYINGGWWATGEAREVGEPVVSTDEWASLNGTPAPAERPSVVAIESAFNSGVSVAQAWSLGSDQALVGVAGYPDLPAAARAALALGAPVLLVGKSLCTDPVFAEVLVEPMQDSTRNAAVALRELLDADQLRHDGSPRLAEQALALRTVPSAEGPRVRSTAGADAVKVAVWAGKRARTAVEPAAVF
jgi:hypothetical protein